MLGGSGKVPVPKSVLGPRALHLPHERVQSYSCRCKSQDSSGGVWFHLHLSSPAGSPPGWRSPSGTLIQDTSQCGHLLAAYLQQSTGMPDSSCQCKGDGLCVDPQPSCDVASKLDITALIRLWLHSEGPGFSSLIWPPYVHFFHQTLAGSTGPLGQKEGRERRQALGREEVSRTWRDGLLHVESGTCEG